MYLSLFSLSRFRQQSTRNGLKLTLVGATLATCLSAGAASALDFTFSFSGDGSVTGLIQGLVDNTNDQSYGLTATITSASYVPTWGWPVFANIDSGGINVSGGLVTSSAISFSDVISGSSLQLYTAATSSLSDFDFFLYGDNLVFSPVSPPPSTATPGPLPLFGAAAALGWSRRLRRRCRTTS